MTVDVVAQSEDFDWTEFATGLTRVGEIDVSSVAELVTRVRGHAISTPAYIDRLNIYAHGTPTYFTVGRDVVHSYRPQDHAPKFRGLQGTLAPSATITLYVCAVGQSEQLIRALAAAAGVKVQANTGDVSPNLGVGWGTWFVAWPDGTAARGLEWGFPPY
jgi:hypothetical protein